MWGETRVETSASGVPRPAVPQTAGATRAIHRAREAALAGGRPAVAPRAEIGASWDRVLRSGIDPDQSTESLLLDVDEIEHRRRARRWAR